MPGEPGDSLAAARPRPSAVVFRAPAVFRSLAVFRAAAVFRASAALGLLALAGCAGGTSDDTATPTSSPAGSATLFPGAQDGGPEDSINFPHVPVGESADMDVEVRNETGERWEHGRPHIAGERDAGAESPPGEPSSRKSRSRTTEPRGRTTQPPTYAIVADGCGDETLAPHGICRFRIRYTPRSGEPTAVGLEIDSPTWPIRAVLSGGTDEPDTTEPAPQSTSGPPGDGTRGPSGRPTGPPGPTTRTGPPDTPPDSPPTDHPTDSVTSPGPGL
ncbi:hypothetical protein [Streptomyces sp. NPDC051776]|uniref:hypothetical protein n=1 Tax=Streptomyces sp. NPDC051776 TaxID=3155414 RepID=UPI003444EFB0